jgi:hypothetical protein
MKVTLPCHGQREKLILQGQDNLLSSLTLYTAPGGKGCLPLGSPLNVQAAFYLFQKHLLCWEYIHSFSHCGRFWSRQKKFAEVCTILHLSPACLFIPAPTTSKLSGH